MNVKITFTRWRNSQFASRTFSTLFGALLALCLLKFGNPVVLDKFVTPPLNLYDWLISSWPVTVCYWLLASVAVIGLLVARWESNAPGWLLMLPLIWLGWQFISAIQTIDEQLSRATLAQFTACAMCFYLGYFALGRGKLSQSYWIGVLGALIIILVSGLQQHFGGLAESRQYFFTYIYPQLKTIPPEYTKKMSSDRIFSTLFYPNALAGALLLLLPPALVVLWRVTTNYLRAIRWAVVGIFSVVSLACLYWSGSKGGWLLMLLIGLIALLRLPFQFRYKITLFLAVFIVGLTGFAVKYSSYFEKGASSVNARFDCWRAALQIAENKPLLGTGPGTFGVAYAKIKHPEAEMARLAHNDYLQQASDSGLLGFIVFLSFIIWALVWSGLKLAVTGDAELLAIWLGLFGWCLQEIFEFGLYTPALGWTAFGLLGWLLKCSGNEFDKADEAS